MDINTLKEILILVATIVTNATISIITLVKVFGHHSNKEKEANDKVVSIGNKTEKAYKDIAILKTKIASIEKCLLEERRK